MNLPPTQECKGSATNPHETTENRRSKFKIHPCRVSLNHRCTPLRSYFSFKQFSHTWKRDFPIFTRPKSPAIRNLMATDKPQIGPFHCCRQFSSFSRCPEGILIDLPSCKRLACLHKRNSPVGPASFVTTRCCSGDQSLMVHPRSTALNTTQFSTVALLDDIIDTPSPADSQELQVADQNVTRSHGWSVRFAPKCLLPRCLFEPSILMLPPSSRTDHDKLRTSSGTTFSSWLGAPADTHKMTSSPGKRLLCRHTYDMVRLPEQKISVSCFALYSAFQNVSVHVIDDDDSALRSICRHASNETLK